jgi:rare lipoprotein A
MRVRLHMATITLLAFAVLSEDWLLASQRNSAGKQTPLVQTGFASWYSSDFNGRKTASGEHYDPEEMTAAHRTLPFGTFVRVINLRNNKSVIVRITNRGPFVRGRIIDVSRAAARRLNMMKSSVTRVRVESFKKASSSAG